MFVPSGPYRGVPAPYRPGARGADFVPEMWGTIVLLMNLGLLLYAGLIPYGLFGFFLRWSTAIVSIAFILHYSSDVVRPIAIFVPFMASGYVAAPLGFDPMASLARLTLMSFSIGVGVLIGYKYDFDVVIKYIVRLLFTCLVVSAAVALLVPDIGMELYGYRLVWKGTFDQKNYLGWASALAIMLTMTVYKGRFKLETLAILSLALVCLVASHSVGSLVAALVAIGYYFVVKSINRAAVSSDVGVVLILVLLSSGFLLYYFFSDAILSVFGRDASFTGRDLVWRAYLREISEYWMFGRGPGAFTSDNSITTAIRENNDFQGQLIKQPHNVYLALLGDAGVPGLLAYLYLMIKMCIWAPVFYRSRAAMAVASMALAHLIVGFTETGAVYTEGLGQLFLAILWGATIQQGVQSLAPPGRGEFSARGG